MALTKRRKVYLAVLGSGLVALALDRGFLASAPVEPQAAQAASPNVSMPQPTRRAGRALAGQAPSRPEQSFADRLEQVAVAHDVQATNIQDAFRPSGLWLNQAKPPAPEEIIKRRLLEFRRKHRLTSVVTAGDGGGSAIVDGQVLRLGQELAGCTLTRISERGVCFKSDDGTEVTLELPGPAESGESHQTEPDQ